MLLSKEDCASATSPGLGKPNPERVQGRPGARRTRSLVCKNKKHTSIVTAGFAGTTGLPRAMVLTAYFVLSPVTGLCCHRRQQMFLPT